MVPWLFLGSGQHIVCGLCLIHVSISKSLKAEAPGVLQHFQGKRRLAFRWWWWWWYPQIAKRIQHWVVMMMSQSWCPYGHSCIVVIVIVVAVVVVVIKQRPAATASCRNIMVMLSLISCDHCSKIMRCSLYMLSNRTPWMCTLIIAPTSY